MYLRKIDYEILKKINDEQRKNAAPVCTTYNLACLLLQKEPNLDHDIAIKYYWDNKLICYVIDNDTRLLDEYNYPFIQVSVIGQAAIEEYERTIEAQLTLPKESNNLSKEANTKSDIANSISQDANKIAIEANHKSDKANKFSLIALIISFLMLIVSIIALIKSFSH